MTTPAMPPPLRAWRDRMEARYPHAAAAVREGVEGLWEIEVALAQANRRRDEAPELRTDTAARHASTLALIAQERRRALRLVGQCLDEQLIGDFVAIAAAHPAT